MKKITINILWFLLNKLDPLNIGETQFSSKGFNIKFRKNFLRKNKWEMITITINAWIKNETEIAEVSLYKNSDLDRRYLLNNFTTNN